jgi:hypothetical protein
MSERSLPERLTISDGDFVAVFLGKEQEAASEFAQHPNVQWVDATQYEEPEDVLKTVPPTTKAFLLTEGIPYPVYQLVTTRARKANALYLHRKNPRALLGTLYELFPPNKRNGNGKVAGKAKSNGETVRVQSGGLKQFLIDFPPDLAKSSAEEARRLQLVAKAKGIPTTFGSLTQSISLMKRKAGRGDIPASVRTVNLTDNALQTLDDAIAGLQLMRDWIENTSKESADLRQQLLTIKRALGVV